MLFTSRGECVNRSDFGCGYAMLNATYYRLFFPLSPAIFFQPKEARALGDLASTRLKSSKNQ
jgi:hypothetical protein